MSSNQSEMLFKRSKKEFLNSLQVCLEVGTLTSFSVIEAFGTTFKKLLQSFSTPLVQGSRAQRELPTASLRMRFGQVVKEQLPELHIWVAAGNAMKRVSALSVPDHI